MEFMGALGFDFRLEMQKKDYCYWRHAIYLRESKFQRLWFAM